MTSDGSSRIVSEISILYEVALASGQSLDLRENCARFLKVLMARKNLAFGSVWIRDEFATPGLSATSAPTDGGKSAVLVYAHPRFRVVEERVGQTHPMFARLEGTEAFSLTSTDEGFSAVVTERGIDDGAVAVFALGELGLLKIVASGRRSAFTGPELNQMTNVVSKFATSVQGCIAHLQVVQEVAERERVEEELQRLNENLEQLVEERTAEIQQAYDQLKQLQSQLVQSEKMAAVGQLAAGVAHEINNPVGFIASNLSTLGEYAGDLSGLLTAYAELEDRLDTGDTQAQTEMRERIRQLKEEADLGFLLEDLDSLIAESREGTERVRKIVQNLKEFSHVDREETSLTNLNAGVESTLNIVWNELKYKADVEKDYGDIPEIECYPQELNQVFMNVLVNAAQAIDKKGTITIRTYQEDQAVCVAITDTGHGMSPEVQARIFEPFYTTKEVGKGTGLGLSMTYNIVRKHGGDLLVDSQVGKGTTFTVRIPIAQGATKDAPGPAR